MTRGMKQERTPYELLWWPEFPSRAAGAGIAGDTTTPLRVYKGSSWRAIEFAGSDIDSSVDNPELLTRYESDVAQCLRELQ